MVEGRVDMHQLGRYSGGWRFGASQAENSYGHSYGRIWE